MMAVRSLAGVLFGVCVISLQVFAQGIVINELYNSSANDEWIELLVVEDSTDIRSWRIKDFTSTGNPSAPPAIRFSTHPVWSNLKAGTVIVVGRSETTLTEDVDPSDYLIVVKVNNAAYVTSGTVFSLAGSSEAVQVLDQDSVHRIGVSWGTANAASLPAPKAHFAGSSSSNTSISYNGDNRDSIVSPIHWTVNNASPTPGLGNSVANTDWMNSFRPTGGDGSGTALIDPDTLNAGDVTTVTITYIRDTAATLTDLRLITSPAFAWSQDTSDVQTTGMTSAITVSGDTVTFNSVVTTGDTLTIAIQSMTAPDTTGFYKFIVQSRVVSDFGDVIPIPQVLVYGLPVPIADIKTNDVNGTSTMSGQIVTVRGIVTVAGEFGGPSYIQDNSAGLSIFGSSFTSQVVGGDEVIVSGRVSQFNGLNQIEDPVLHSVVSQGNPVEPMLVAISQIVADGTGGVEQFEGRLVEMNAVTVTDLANNPIAQWGSGANYRLHDATGFMEIRVDNNVDFANTPAPQSSFDVLGVVGQFKTSSPFIGGYQIMPRTAGDLRTTGPVFQTLPRETDISPTSMTIVWTTVDSGSSQLRYGLTPSYELGTSGSTDLKQTHSVTLTDLSPATIYLIQAFSVRGPDTSTAGRIIVSTASAGSSGDIEVYFNKSIDTSVAVAETAQANVDFVSKLLERIDAAQYSIDVCLYSLSGTVGATVATALINAKNRGVKIRVIGEKDNQGTAPWTTLKNGGITVIDDAYDPVNAGAGLMHNKFLVFDYRGGPEDSIWVWTGSWNITDPGTNNDMQNVIAIQDKALAGAYTVEFQEMWGGSTDTPSAATSRFGARKTDNTPHRFLIGGVPTELYFSPSDRTTSKIIETVNRAEHSVNIALLTFTRSDIATALNNRHNAGVRVRGLLDNSSDTGSQFNFLVNNGMDFLLDINSAFLHHKYAVIDAEVGKSLPNYVITGSHNWSSSAENSNNENTLLIEDHRIANHYLQEFKARYTESGGSGTIVVKVGDGKTVPESFGVSQNYPNPFNGITNFELRVAGWTFVDLRVYDVLGREVSTILNGPKAPGFYSIQWNSGNIPTGVYFLRMLAGTYAETRKLLLVR